MLIRDYLLRNAAVWPDRPAYTSPTRALTWGQIAARSKRLAAALQARGVGPGDVVASMAFDSHEVAEIWYACSLIGAVRVGINPRYAPNEVQHLLVDSDARVLIIEGGDCEDTFDRLEKPGGHAGPMVIGFGDHRRGEDYETLLAQANEEPNLPDLNGDDVMAISYTTGTTGLPKGALWTHGGVVESLVKSWFQTGLRTDDVFLHCLPAAGVPVLLLTNNVVNGSRVVIQRKFSAGEALDLIDRERVTALLWVPTMIVDVLRENAARPRDISSLRLVVYGSAPATPALVRQASRELGCELQQWYGSTEGTLGCYAILSWEDHRLALEDRPEILSSSGRPTLHCDVAILDDDLRPVPPGGTGNVCVRGATLMKGYHRRPEETAEVLRDGWLITGDLGRLEDGYLYLVDRRNFLIITGAYNVFPIVVENALAEHAGVSEVCVFGIPDPRWGEVVCAVVVPTADYLNRQDELRDELMTWSRERLAKFEVPKQIDFRADLPRGATGKVLKRALRDAYREASNS